MADDIDYMGEQEPSMPTEAEAPKPTESESPKTAILPVDFFQGKEPQPGDTCEVTVEAVHDGQIEVSYKSSEASEEEVIETEVEMEPGEEAAVPSEMEA